jgi:hypothetical protein
VIRHALVTTLKAPDRDRQSWLSRPVEERVAAVETLRRQLFEGEADAEQRLQRVDDGPA